MLSSEEHEILVIKLSNHLKKSPEEACDWINAIEDLWYTIYPPKELPKDQIKEMLERNKNLWKE
jgi:hypothetical protein